MHFRKGGRGWAIRQDVILREFGCPDDSYQASRRTFTPAFSFLALNIVNVQENPWQV
jgi:hypothetical protein